VQIWVRFSLLSMSICVVSKHGSIPLLSAYICIRRVSVVMYSFPRNDVSSCASTSGSRRLGQWTAGSVVELWIDGLVFTLFLKNKHEKKSLKKPLIFELNRSYAEGAVLQCVA
jgi:hypothetical protein